MITVAISNLRHRWISFVGVFVTVMAAAALMTATGALLEAGIRGPAAPERLAAADIVVAADQNVSESRGTGDDHETVSSPVSERVRVRGDLVQKVRAVDGVRSAVAEVSFPAVLLTPGHQLVATPDDGPSLGHAWTDDAAGGFALTNGRAPAAAGEVVLDTGLAHRAGVRVGDTVGAVVAGHPASVSVTGLAKPTSGSALRVQAAVFFAAATAAELYDHPGYVDLVEVSVVTGADPADVAAAIDRAVGADEHVVVLTGDDRGQAEFLDSAESSLRLIAISGSLGGIAMFVAALVLVGMLTLFIQQRQRDVALLRAVGATPRQVRRMISLEALLVTVLGAAVGVWPGLLLAGRLSVAMQDKGLLPDTFTLTPSVWPAASAVTAAVIVCTVAAGVAGRRASKVRPIEALVSSVAPTTGVGWIRAALGLIFAAGTAVLAMVTTSVSAALAPAIALALMMTSMVTVGLFAPLLVRLGIACLGVVGRVLGVGGFLAVANSSFHSRRLASAVTPLALTVGIAGMTMFQQSTLDSEATAQGRDRVTADRVVAAPAGLPPGAVAQLASREIGTVVGLADTSVYGNFELDPYAAKAVTPGHLDDVLDLDVVDGSLTELRPGQVALSQDAAESLGATVGQRADVRLGDGTQAHPVVVATYHRSMGFADVLLPWDSVAAHVTDPTVSLLLVNSTGEERRADAALHDLRRSNPAIAIGGPEIIMSAEDANAETQAWVNYVLLGLVILFSAFAVLNTLMLSIRDRSREFGLLQLVGTTRRQVRHMMRVEAVMLLVLGWTLGAAVAVVTVSPFAKAVTGSFMPSIPLVPALGLIATTAVLAGIGTMVPTRATLRRRPVDALGVRE